MFAYGGGCVGDFDVRVYDFDRIGVVGKMVAYDPCRSVVRKRPGVFL